MFLLPASQQSCWSSSRKLKHKERKSLIKIIPGEHFRVFGYFHLSGENSQISRFGKICGKKRKKNDAHNHPRGKSKA